MRLQTKKRLALLATTLLLSACGTRIDSMQNTIEYAVLGQPDVTLTPTEIQALSYPVQYLTLADQSRISIALGYDDKGLYKWLSGNQEALVTRAGRIVQTQGITIEGVPRDIEWVSELSSDPLACITRGDNDCDTRWRAQVQLSDGVNMQTLRIDSQFSRAETQLLTAPDGTELNTQKWREDISSNGQQWTNWYWVETRTHRVIKSRQKLAYSLPEASLEEVKPYAKDLAVNGAQQ